MTLVPLDISNVGNLTTSYHYVNMENLFSEKFFKYYYRTLTKSALIQAPKNTYEDFDFAPPHRLFSHRPPNDFHDSL